MMKLLLKHLEVEVLVKYKKAAVSWSGGKDSCLALYYILNSENIQVTCLLTTFTKEFDRVSMHGIRRELVELQASSLGYEIEKVYIPYNSSNEVYEKIMEDTLKKLLSKGIDTYIFGDIFLEDVKKYREKNLEKLNLQGIWPIWGKNTLNLAKEFIELGFKAIICCIDTKYLNEKYLGKEFNEEFINELPNNVDPCGENGEFHTFVYNGPIFKKEIKFKLGEKILRDNRFYYIDLIPLK